jgi:hypothetical protein
MGNVFGKFKGKEDSSTITSTEKREKYLKRVEEGY